MRPIDFCSISGRFVLFLVPARTVTAVTIFAASDFSGSGRVDMLTYPVATARAAVATERQVKLTHDTYLIRGSVGA